MGYDRCDAHQSPPRGLVEDGDMVYRMLFVMAMLMCPVCAIGQVHYTYLWHLEQPIYWPAPDSTGNRYQRAYESIMAKASGALHPMDNLTEIFGKDDRVAAYQWRPKDSLWTLLGYPEAGVQVSYSGGLIENVLSLAEAQQLGYSANWNAGFKEARVLKTSNGASRMDIVMFPFHHPLLPLTDDRVVRMELALYKAVYPEAWGPGAPSRGLFPPEMAFSERLIPALVEAGIEWVIVSNAHISRACKNYPWVPGSGGDNIPPPNRADAQNPAQSKWNRISIDRGVSPANAYPFSYRPHRARFVAPATGQAATIIVVPAAQAESWKDGYSCYGLDAADEYASSSEPDHPILVVLAHDGDNAFGGGYSYYMECVPGLAATAKAKGYIPTTIEGYLYDHPVAPDDIVHVEDGAWVNADGDFGAPAFWNWNWPLVDATGAVNPATGWAEDERNFAVIMAATNWVATAEDATNQARPEHVLNPLKPGTTEVERAWHFLLGALNSGYMYYGKSLDMELKPVVACNEAVRRAKKAMPANMVDKTPPTVFVPQHWPDNPGGINYGPVYKYKQVELPPDTFFWTFAYDVSGVASATFRYRVDADGENPLWSDDNETYAGGPGVGPWQALPMQRREFPKGNPFNDPEIDTSILPEEIADVYWLELTGLKDVLLDWYVEVSDWKGNVTRTAIQHLYIGSGGSDAAKWTPSKPDCDDAITINHPKPGKLHWGINGWKEPPQSLWPSGTVAFGDGKSVETPMSLCEKGFCVTIGPLGDQATVVDFVFHHADGTWDNNNGADWHITIAPCGAGGEATGPEVSAPEPVADEVTIPEGPESEKDSGVAAEEPTGMSDLGGHETAVPDAHSPRSDTTLVPVGSGGGGGCLASHSGTSWLLIAMSLALSNRRRRAASPVPPRTN